MTIYTITASEDELCGELFFSFGGFFSEEFRQYDYNQGRRKAQEFLKTHANASGPKEIGPIRYVPGPVPPNSNKNLPKTKMEDLDYDLRSKLKEQIQDRAEEILSDAKITGISGWIAAKIVSSKLKALFKL